MSPDAIDYINWTAEAIFKIVLPLAIPFVILNFIYTRR